METQRALCLCDLVVRFWTTMSSSWNLPDVDALFSITKEQVPALFGVRGQDCTVFPLLISSNETIALEWKMPLWGYMCMFVVLHHGIYLHPLACTVSSAFERSHFELVYACGQSLPLFSLLHSFLRVVKALLLKWTGLQGHMKLEPTKFCTSC